MSTLSDDVGARKTDSTTAITTAWSRALPGVDPEFIRLPKPGTTCPRTGLSRAKMNEMVLPSEENHHSPPVKSISLRNANQLHAVRLVVYSSLINYLRSFATVSHEVAK